MIANQAGTAVWRWDQGEPFGNDVPNNNPSGAGAFDFPLRFPGQYFDRETNLAYNVMRDYDPMVGRYIESDPIGLRTGLNTYAYVGSNPLDRVDPLGLYTCYYSITAGVMECEPDNPGNPKYNSGGWHSGKGPCKDNPACGQVKDTGPTPPLTCYRIGGVKKPRAGQVDRFRRDLIPFDPNFVFPRDNLQIHSCGNAPRDGCSIGCVVNDDSTIKRFNSIIDLEPSILCVSN